LSSHTATINILQKHSENVEYSLELVSQGLELVSQGLELVSQGLELEKNITMSFPSHRTPEIKARKNPSKE
jgi:hypothetical protein